MPRIAALAPFLPFYDQRLDPLTQLTQRCRPLIVGGARYVMAGGDVIKLEKAKSAITSAALGYAFAIFAPVVITIIQQIVGG